MSADQQNQLIHHFLIINENGDIFLDADEPALSNFDQINEIHQNLKLTEKFELITEFEDTLYYVESFDHPLQIIAVEFKDKGLILQSRQNTLHMANPQKWSVDEWDRFNGLTTNNAPFVLTDRAQNQLFNISESYDDEGFVLAGQYISTPPYFIDSADIAKESFWSQIYQTEENPGWNLKAPAEAFKDMLPRLKLPKSRILVLGCGEGHDAAFFAEAGHVVTAVDFSKEAITRAKKNYGHIDKIHFHEANIFHLPQDWNQSFDLVVEHTCFCAIPPDQRNEAVRLWRRMLHEEGQFMGVFFTMEKRAGPPYGATEWELRKRLQNYFQFLFWGRWRQSLPQRQGRELFVLAQKKNI